MGFFAAALLVAAQFSIADNKPGCGKGCQGGQNTAQQSLTPEEKKKYDHFLEETVDLRKEMADKEAEYRKLMGSDKPDPAQAAMLTNEFYQLRDALTEKAHKAGIVQTRRGCNGCSGKPGVACNRSPAAGKVETTN